MYGRKSVPKRRIRDWQKYQEGVEEKLLYKANDSAKIELSIINYPNNRMVFCSPEADTLKLGLSAFHNFFSVLMAKGHRVEKLWEYRLNDIRKTAFKKRINKYKIYVIYSCKTLSFALAVHN